MNEEDGVMTIYESYTLDRKNPKKGYQIKNFKKGKRTLFRKRFKNSEELNKYIWKLVKEIAYLEWELKPSYEYFTFKRDLTNLKKQPNNKNIKKALKKTRKVFKKQNGELYEISTNKTS